MEKQSFYFECKKGGHNKFWAIEISIKKGRYYLIRRYGKIGQEGKTMVEEFANTFGAYSRREKLVREKLEKDYEAIL